MNYDEDDESSSYTVCMKGTPPGHDVAAVVWAESAQAALFKAARMWHCKPENCEIYGEGIV